EDGIRDFHVTGVQTCALPIFENNGLQSQAQAQAQEQYCGGGDCNKECCVPCKPKKVKCKEYKCKEVCICKPKCNKYEYVIKKPNNHCKKEKKCFDYCDKDSSWFYDSYSPNYRSEEHT